jgi:hypothetical protein
MQAGSTAAVSAAIGSVKGQLLKSVLGMNMFLVRGQGRGAAPATLEMRTYIPSELMPCLDYELPLQAASMLSLTPLLLLQNPWHLSES